MNVMGKGSNSYLPKRDRLGRSPLDGRARTLALRHCRSLSFTPPNSAKLDNPSPIGEMGNAKPHVRESYGTTQCVEASVFSHRGFFFARSQTLASPLELNSRASLRWCRSAN